MSKVYEKVKTRINQAKYLATSAAVAMACPTGNVLAAAGSANSIVETIAETVVNIFPLIGIFFVIAGAFKLFMAYRNNNPEDQTAAAKDIVIGAVFIVFRVFVWTSLKTAIF